LLAFYVSCLAFVSCVCLAKTNHTHATHAPPRTPTHWHAHSGTPYTLTPTHPHTHTDAELSALAIKCRGFMGTCHLACLSAPHFATDKHKECVSVSAQGSFTVGVSKCSPACVCAYSSGTNSSSLLSIK